MIYALAIHHSSTLFCIYPYHLECLPLIHNHMNGLHLYSRMRNHEVHHLSNQNFQEIVVLVQAFQHC